MYDPLMKTITQSYGSFTGAAPLMFYEIFQNEVRRKQIHQNFDNSVARIVFLYKK